MRVQEAGGRGQGFGWWRADRPLVTWIRQGLAPRGAQRSPSWRLRTVVWCYGVAAALSTALSLWTMGLVLHLISPPGNLDHIPVALADRPYLLLHRVLVPASMWLTWRLLSQRRRSGAIVAAIPSLLALRQQGFMFDPTTEPLLLPLIFLIGLASVWRELD